MLEGLFHGNDNNFLLIIILIFLLFSGDIFGGKDKCGRGGLFDDNIIWILILFLFIGDIF